MKSSVRMRVVRYVFVVIFLLIQVACNEEDGNSLVMQMDGKEICCPRVRSTAALGEIVIAAETDVERFLLMFSDTLQEGEYHWQQRQFVMTCSKDAGATRLLVRQGTLTLTMHRKKENRVAGTFEALLGKAGGEEKCRIKGTFRIHYEKVGLHDDLSSLKERRSQKSPGRSQILRRSVTRKPYF